MEPLVSVIMAAYNSEKFVGAAIESILAQTYNNFELLIIEDASTDRTDSVIKSYRDIRIRVLSNEHNSGTLYCMQRGVEEAKGKYVAVLDSDDIAEPERIRMQVKVLEKKPEVLLCATKVKNLVDDRLERNEYLPIKNARQLRFLLLFENVIAHSSIMFRKKELQIRNIQYETYSYCHDYNLIMNVGQISPIYVINRELGQYRIHRKKKTNILSKKKIALEVNSVKERFVQQINELDRDEKDILCKAVWGKLRNFGEYYKLRKVLFHYASLCHLNQKEDKKLILYGFYKMFYIQPHSYRWYVYYMVGIYLRNASGRIDEWAKMK